MVPPAFLAAPFLSHGWLLIAMAVVGVVTPAHHAHEEEGGPESGQGVAEVVGRGC